MQLVREKLHNVVERWNSHKIRKQKNRPNLPTGNPWNNYYFSKDGVEDYTNTSIPNTLNYIQKRVGDSGQYHV